MIAIDKIGRHQCDGCNLPRICVAVKIGEPRDGKVHWVNKLVLCSRCLQWLKNKLKGF